MGALPEDLRQDIHREARVAGLGHVPPSLERVESRGVQLWLVFTLVLLSATAAALLTAIRPAGLPSGPLPPVVTGAGLALIALAFAAYTVEKEVHLRRLKELLIQERVRSTALARQVEEMTGLLAAARAMNSVFCLQDVLDVILGYAIDLVGGNDGSVMVEDGDETLRPFCVQGRESAHNASVMVGDWVAGRVAWDKRSIVVNGPGDVPETPDLLDRTRGVRSAILLPLISHGETVGVLNVNSGDHLFTEMDVRTLCVFAEHAAGAIANARMREAERIRMSGMMVRGSRSGSS